VIPSSPESIHPSEHKASEGWDRPHADGGAPNASPSRASLARQPDSRKDQFPEFWEAIGHHATVAESEQAISEFLSAGIEYGDIIAGGRRWAAYNVATGGRHRASPLQWLRKEKWRDDWTVLVVLNSAPRAAETGAKPSRGSVKGTSAKTRKTMPKQKLKPVAGQKATTTHRKSFEQEYGELAKDGSNINPQYITWKGQFEELKNRSKQKYAEFQVHRTSCNECICAQNEDELCETGFLIFLEHKSLDNEVCDWRKVNLPPPQYTT